MPRVGFELTILLFEQANNTFRASDVTATLIGKYLILKTPIM
jgi:hypothetical protein